MSESETNADDSAPQETGGASQGAPDQSVQRIQTDNSTSVEDFVSEGEQTVLKQWLLFVAGLNAALGIGLGLNAIIQGLWSHTLVSNYVTVSFMGSTATAGLGFRPFTSVGGLMTLGIVVSTLFGYIYARNVSNEENTAYKVAIATALVGVPVLSILGGLLLTQPGSESVEIVNVLVSSLGAGIAAAIGSVIVVFLTEEQTPDALAS